MASRLPIDRDALRRWMVDYILSVLDLPAERVRTDETFDSYGFDSVEAVVMAGVMEEEFGIPVDPIQMFEHPTIDDFASTYCRDTDVAIDDGSGIKPGEFGDSAARTP